MKIFIKNHSNWQELQLAVAQVLSECEFEVEVEKKVTTVRGIVEIDVFAIDHSTIPKSTFICECKNWNKAVPQEKIHAFNTVIQNIGANHGLFISKIGFQSGAIEAAKYTNISLLNWDSFQDLYKERWIKSKLKKLHVLSEELAEYTDVLTTEFECEFKALSNEERKLFTQYMTTYIDVVIRCSKYMMDYEIVDSVILTKSSLFPNKYECYNDYFNDLIHQCNEGTRKFRELLYKG